MILAAVRDNPYNLVLLLHIATAFVAFAPAFVHPLLNTQTKELDTTNRSAVLRMVAGNGRKIYAPALLVSGLLGFALQGMSDSVWSFSQTWMWGSAVVWIAMNGILHAVLLPAEQAAGDGDQAAESKVQAAEIAVIVLLIVMLYLMIFKPGF